MKTDIGYKDKNGTEIREGDLVEFWFDTDEGPSGDKNSGFTRMVDVVEIHDGIPYFVDKDMGSGAYAGRYNDVCEIIGNIHDVLPLT